MRILIADDNEWGRQGVRVILAGDSRYEICGEAADGGETVRMARDLQPRIVRREHPGIRIIIMSQHDASVLLPDALEAGAQGCVDKSQLHSDLLQTIGRIC